MLNNEAHLIVETLADWENLDKPGKHLLYACAKNYMAKFGDVCPDCKGKWTVPGTDKPCLTCNATGRVLKEKPNA